MAESLPAPPQIIDFANQHGYEIVRSFTEGSKERAFLAKKERTYYVLKWPEEGYWEKEAMSIWSKSAGPAYADLGEAYSLDYLSGRNPFYWNKGDLVKLEEMFQQMHSAQPSDLEKFPPLSHKLEQIYDHLQRSPLRWSNWAAEELQAAEQLREQEKLIHGDLHPWNIFLRDRATLIDPYGLRGDPGYDLAFLAASLAHDQEEFLEEMSLRLRLPSARRWFWGLVVYRLDNSMRHGTEVSLRPLRKLYSKITP